MEAVSYNDEVSLMQGSYLAEYLIFGYKVESLAAVEIVEETVETEYALVALKVVEAAVAEEDKDEFLFSQV